MAKKKKASIADVIVNQLRKKLIDKPKPPGEATALIEIISARLRREKLN